MSVNPRWQLLRDAAAFQVKLLLDAIRDIALSPLSLVAALIDLAFAGSRPPKHFYAVLRLGRRSEAWIDLWAAGLRESRQSSREEPVRDDAPVNADWVMNRVEALIRDPHSGARDALVLKRWARMRLARSAVKPEL